MNENSDYANLSKNTEYDAYDEYVNLGDQKNDDMSDDSNSCDEKGNDKNGDSIDSADKKKGSKSDSETLLPIANISRIMKRILPGSAKVAKESKDIIRECVTEFIQFLTSEASDRCTREKRKTINGEDILYSMEKLGFNDYIEPLTEYLNKWKQLKELNNSNNYHEKKFDNIKKTQESSDINNNNNNSVENKNVEENVYTEENYRIMNNVYNDQNEIFETNINNIYTNSNDCDYANGV